MGKCISAKEERQENEPLPTTKCINKFNCSIPTVNPDTSVNVQ